MAPSDSPHPAMVDISPGASVEIEMSVSGQTIWINVNGQCVLRVSKPKELTLTNLSTVKS